MTARPTVLLIGAARSATTAVATALRRHPEVFITEPKEPHFFAFVGEDLAFTGPGDDEMMNKVAVTDPDRYDSLYRRRTSERLWGDGSVSTLYYASRSIDTIRAYADPKVKLVCILREPAARARSAYLYLRSRGYEDRRSFAEGLAAEDQRVATGFHHMWHYTRMSRYSEQVPAFAAAFGHRLFVGITEELQADPQLFALQLGDFLEIEPRPELDVNALVNKGGEPRSELAARMLARARSVEPVRRAVRRLVPSYARERIRRANIAEPSEDSALMSRLRSYFARDVAAIEEWCGRTIEAWRSGELGSS